MGFYYPNRQGRYFSSIEKLAGHVTIEEIKEIAYHGSQFPESLIQFKYLEKLELYAVTKVEDTLQALPHLRELRLLSSGYMGVDKLPQYDLALPALEKLVLAREYFLKLNPESFAWLSSLKYLRLERNFLGTFPEKVLQLKSLKSLHINLCDLPAIPAGIQSLSHLEELSLIGNGLKMLPKEVGKLEHLKVLNISSNKLKVMPASIGNLKSLHYLNCDHNNFKLLPSEIGDLKSLEHFSMKANKLEALPDEIVGCTSLQFLDVSYNKINTLPNELGDLSNLKEFHCLRNKLVSLPVSLGKLANLEKLILSENPLNWSTFSLQDVAFKRLMFKYLYAMIQGTPNAHLSDQLGFVPPTLADNPLKEGAVVAKTGRTSLKVKEFKPQLEALGITYQAKFDKKVTHLIVARLPKIPLNDLLDSDVTFISEAQLNEFMASKQAPDPTKYLLQQDDERTTESIHKLKGLLLSEDDQNVAIAVELIKAGGFPKELHTELFMAYKLVDDSKVRKEIKPLLEQYSSEKAKEAMRQRWALFTEAMDEKKLRRNINKYTQNNEFDGPKIARYFWDRYQKGILYLFSYGSNEQIVDALPKGDTLDFTGLNINVLPEVFEELKHVKKIFLKECDFVRFPKVLFKMPWLEVLSLEHNYFEQLPKEMKKLTSLKTLNLNYNMLREFPEVLYEMPHLKKIMFKSWYDEHVDAATIEKVREKLPNCELIYL